jgi:hypothetical protein
MSHVFELLAENVAICFGKLFHDDFPRKLVSRYEFLRN